MDKRILVVERDRWVRLLFHTMFRNLGSLTLTCSRAEALNEIAKGRFDVVVTEFDLARLGFGWVDELVALGIPTVVTTARSSAEELRRINPAARVFGRPFYPHTVRNCVEAMLTTSPDEPVVAAASRAG